jgi:heme exporter protein A
MLTRTDHTASLDAVGLAAAPGGRRLFADLDVQVQAGDALFVAGANGAGKTTLLRILCGLTEPLSGRVTRRAHHLTYIGHAPALKGELTAHENLRVAMRVAGFNVADSQVARALDHFGLAGRGHVPARTLSQGQRRRVSLARLTLSDRPGILVLDEPFVALDALASEVLAQVLAARLSEGSALVYTTHEPRRLAARRHHTVRLGRATSELVG